MSVSQPVDTTVAAVLAAVRMRGYDYGDPQLIDAVAGAYREIMAARTWPFLDNRTTALQLQAGVAEVSLGGVADLLHVDAVRIDGGADDSYDLHPENPQALRTKLNRDQQTGVPCEWARHGDELFVYPTPDRARVLAVDYRAQPPALTSTADLLLIPALYVDCVVWGTVAILAFRQRDWSAASYATEQRDSAVMRMVRAMHIQQRQAPRQVTTGFWGRPR